MQSLLRMSSESVDQQEVSQRSGRHQKPCFNSCLGLGEVGVDVGIRKPLSVLMFLASLKRSKNGS